MCVCVCVCVCVWVGEGDCNVLDRSGKYDLSKIPIFLLKRRPF